VSDEGQRVDMRRVRLLYYLVRAGLFSRRDE